MKKELALAVVLGLSLTGMSAAEEGHSGHTQADAATTQMKHGGMDHQGMKMGKANTTDAKDMHAMHSHMQALHDHSKMMEGITDSTKLGEEMKKHMRMMNSMMDSMMQSQMQATGEGAATP